MLTLIKNGALAIVIAGAFLIISSLPSPAEEAGAAKSLAGTKPNIVFILTDDQTFDSLSKMPYLSSRTDWTTFENAYVQTALCCNSRATILTGQYDTHTGVLDISGPQNGEQLDESETIAVWLDERGYTTGLFGKYLNQYPWSRGNYIPPGWDEWFAFNGLLDGDRYYTGYSINANGTTKVFGTKAEDYSTDVLASRATRFIKHAKEPFFVYFAPYAPHKPFTPAPRHEGVYKNEVVNSAKNVNEDDVSDKPAFIRALSKANMPNEKKDTQDQWESLLAVDEAIKAIVQELKERNVLEKTVIVFMSDNGFAHGEHRWVGKRCAYDTCLQVPMLVYYPGHNKGTIHKLVSNVDIAYTFLHLAGIKPEISQDGRSLVPIIEESGVEWREGVLSHWGGGGKVQGSNPPNFWSVRTDRYRYTEYATGEKELYDYKEDPYELSNKAGKDNYKSVQASMKKTLDSLKNDALAPSEVGLVSKPAVSDVANTTHIAEDE